VNGRLRFSTPTALRPLNLTDHELVCRQIVQWAATLVLNDADDDWWYVDFSHFLLLPDNLMATAADTQALVPTHQIISTLCLITVWFVLLSNVEIGLQDVRFWQDSRVCATSLVKIRRKNRISVCLVFVSFFLQTAQQHNLCVLCKRLIKTAQSDSKYHEWTVCILTLTCLPQDHCDNTVVCVCVCVCVCVAQFLQLKIMTAINIVLSDDAPTLLSSCRRLSTVLRLSALISPTMVCVYIWFFRDFW